MPELNPRRVNSQKGRFAQVSAAVLAGMAAMFCLQNVIEFRREALPPAATAPVPLPPDEAEPASIQPLPEGVRRQAGPVPSSMLLKPEPGLSAGAAVIGVSGEEAPPRYEAPARADAPKPKKAMPHLEDRAMTSSFASSAVRNDGRFSSIKRRAPAEAAPPPSPVAPAPKVLSGASGIKPLEKAAAPPDNLQNALIAQSEPPERLFWTKERKFNIGAAVIALILGLVYLVYASGIRNEPPERAEGEF